MKKLKMKKVGNIAQTTKYLQEQASTLGKSVELVDSFSNETHFFGVYEKYYYRAGNYATLSLCLRQVDDLVILEAIAAGGGGSIFNVSWGCEEAFCDKFQALMKAFGYETIVQPVLTK